MGFASESRERTRPVLPLAGMVDVLFLLLIFFMTTSLYRERETQIPIDLPTAENAEPSTANVTKIVINFDGTGQVFLGHRPMTLEELGATLRELAQEFPDESVEIRGDQAGQYGLLIKLMDLSRDANLTDIRLSAARPAEQAGP